MENPRVIWLVEPPLWKILKVNGKDDIPYIMANKMFDTTNQL